MNYIEHILFISVMTSFCVGFFALGYIIYDFFQGKINYFITISISLLPCVVGALLFIASIYDVYFK